MWSFNPASGQRPFAVWGVGTREISRGYNDSTLSPILPENPLVTEVFASNALRNTRATVF